ncbi:unnamed protein product, partial [Ixodes pacificus]
FLVPGVQHAVVAFRHALAKHARSSSYAEVLLEVCRSRSAAVPAASAVSASGVSAGARADATLLPTAERAQADPQAWLEEAAVHARGKEGALPPDPQGPTRLGTLARLSSPIK